jgi:ATP-binding cassette, subfamily B, bacterial
MGGGTLPHLDTTRNHATDTPPGIDRVEDALVTVSYYRSPGHVLRMMSGLRTCGTLAAMKLFGSGVRALRLARLGLDLQRGLTLVFLGCVILSGLFSPAFTIAIGALVAAVADGEGAWLALAVVGALYLFEDLLGPIQQEIGNALARRINEQLSQRLMVALSKPPGLAHIEDPAMLDAIAKAQGTLVGVTPGGAVSRLGGVWNLRLQGALSLVIVGSWRWWAPIVLVPVYALRFLVSRWHWYQVTQVMLGRTEELRRSYYLRGLALSSALAKETRVFGLAGWLVDRYRASWLAVMRDVWRRRHEGWLVALGVVSLDAVVEGVIIFAVAAEAAAGGLALGHAVTLATAVLASGALSIFNDAHWHVGEGAEALARLDAIDPDPASPIEQRDQLGGVVGGSASADELPRAGIRFEGVRFCYPGRDKPVFTALDLEVEAGRSLAIVGENGAGKTTLVKLLARLHDPDAGRITVDGVDLRQIAPHAWHRRIAAIFQDFTQFELSAEDNVAFGALHRAGDRAAIERAAAQAGAAGVIARLPDGWDTPLSRELVGGTQLSGGEWQRLALARALFAVQAGAGMLVLDEPTASLDVRGEAEVYDRFLELTRGVTTIVISHRFSTVRRADRIVVLEHGRVIEDGRHDELVAAGGRYATMYALQAARFQGPDDGDA